MSADDDGVHAFQVGDWLLIVREIEGLGRVASAVQLPPPGSSPELIEGVRRRLLIASVGKCPCGAAVVPISREVAEQMTTLGEFPTMDVRHEPGCPATYEAVVATQNRAQRRARKRGER